MPKAVRLSMKYYFITKIPNKTGVQQTTSNHSSDIKAKNFLKLYIVCTKEFFPFLVNDTTLTSDNPLRFRKKLSSNDSS